MNFSSNNEKIKSKKPRKKAVNKEITITTIVNQIAWLLVGQLTCFNSAFVSFR